MSETAKELIDGIAELYPGEGLLPAMPQELARRVEAVLALHQPCCADMEAHDGHVFDSCDHWEGRWCECCLVDWPCPTVRRLNGEAANE